MVNAVANLKNKILFGVFCLLIILFAFSLFKNIGYPLLWNDEAETAMYATRILNYGYPKVHDGRNVVYISSKIPVEAGIDGRSDAYLGGVWGQYYFGAIGEFFAQKTNDIYIKTAVLRIPFALIGFIGVVIMALAVINIFKKRLTDKLLFLIFFVFLELLSVSLALHLREVRYYSLVVFLSAGIFYAYINYRFIEKINFASYFFITTALLLFLFNTFPPTYFIFLISIGLYESLDLLRRRRLKGFIINLSPLVASFITVIPFLIFFKIFSIGRGDLARAFQITLAVQYVKIISLLHFFLKYEFLSLVLVVKLILVSVSFYLRRSDRLKSVNQEKMEEINRKAQISNFLSLFFVIYLLVITKVPVFVIYERYYIILQLVLVIVLLLDVLLIFEYISNISCSPVTKTRAKVIILFLISVTFLLGGLGKIGPVKNHIYEIFHRYQGPLDFVIPYIRTNYKNPEELVIATNYEEYSYMYYLGSKTTIGHEDNNLEEDLMLQPDIVIFRKSYPQDIQIFNDFLQKERYARVSFPCFDYPVNNIPESNVQLPPHLYKTKIAENEDERLDIYIRT
ncbi:MAG: hypothetical protein PHY56_05450 [Candidatus Omnitrophica bacterium]|nr:hypothetical protein [Candidatus Omnitrophota bacterium]